MLTGLDADVVEMCAEYYDAGTCDSVFEFSHCDDSVQDCIPTARGLLRCLAQPSDLLPYVLPYIVAIENRRKLSVLGFLSASTANVFPMRAQILLDLVDLVVETFLEANEGALMTGGDEVQLIDELRPTLVPGFLIMFAIVCCVANVEGEDAQRHSLVLGEDFHSQRCGRGDVELSHCGVYSGDIGGLLRSDLRSKTEGKIGNI